MFLQETWIFLPLVVVSTYNSSNFTSIKQSICIGVKKKYDHILVSVRTVNNKQIQLKKKRNRIIVSHFPTQISFPYFEIILVDPYLPLRLLCTGLLPEESFKARSIQQREERRAATIDNTE